MKYCIAEPVRVTYDLLTYIRETGKELPSDAMTLARAYRYPIFCMLQEYGMVRPMGGDAASVLDKIESHIAFFWKGIMKLEYD